MDTADIEQNMAESAGVLTLDEHVHDIHGHGVVRKQELAQQSARAKPEGTIVPIEHAHGVRQPHKSPTGYCQVETRAVTDESFATDVHAPQKAAPNQASLYCKLKSQLSDLVNPALALQREIDPNVNEWQVGESFMRLVSYRRVLRVEQANQVEQKIEA